MQNKIWEQICEFLNRLRCENVTRETAVEIPRYKETLNEIEMLRERCETILQKLPQETQQIFLEWIAKAEDMNSLEGQKAYCQGYIDCIFMLSGMGLLQHDLSLEKLTKWIKQ